MSIMCCVYVPEGIVLAADSRLTNNKSNMFPGTIMKDESKTQNLILKETYYTLSDNAQKVLLIKKNNVGVSFCGNAFINGMTVFDFIRKFEIDEITSNDSTESTAVKLSNYGLNESITFIVAGFDNDVPYVYTVCGRVVTRQNIIPNIQINQNSAKDSNLDDQSELGEPKEIIKPQDSQDIGNTAIPTLKYGAVWGGKMDAITKVINVQPELIANYTSMPLKDAIDFAEFLIDLTIKYERFSDDIQTCGGEIDILVITKDDAFWKQHKVYNPKKWLFMPWNVLDMSWNGLGFLPRQRKNEQSHLKLCPFAILSRQAHVMISKFKYYLNENYIANDWFLWYNIIMKKISCIIVFIICLPILLLSGCTNNNSEIKISQIDSKSYTIYEESSSPVIIDFDDFDNFTQEQYPSRSYCYTKFVLKFQNTPDGYDAYDVFHVLSVKISRKENETLSNSEYEYDNYYINARKCDKDRKSIELLLQTPYFCLQTDYKIKSISYRYFDSVVGQNIDKTIEVNYKFTPKFVDNFLSINTNSHYNYTITQYFKANKTDNCSKTLYEFTIETNLEYDSIIYNVDKIGVYYDLGKKTVIETESIMSKKDIYQYENPNNEYYWRIQFTIVGLIKDNIKSYFNPITYVMNY